MTGLDYYVKEFSKISMDPSQTIIIDNQPISYLLNKGTQLLKSILNWSIGTDACGDSSLIYLSIIAHHTQRVPYPSLTSSTTLETRLCWISSHV